MLHSGGFMPYWNDRLGLKSVLAGESITCDRKFYIIDSTKTDKIFVRFPGKNAARIFLSVQVPVLSKFTFSSVTNASDK
jgi:hypothetical protein